MWLVLCALCLWLQCSAVVAGETAVPVLRRRPVRHAMPPRGMRTASVTASSWVCAIRIDGATATVTQRHGETAPASLFTASEWAPLMQRDGCYLLRGNADSHMILLEIYCGGSASGGGGDAPERPLEHTMDAMAARYGIDNLALERNKHMDHQPPDAPARRKRLWRDNVHNMQELASQTKRPHPGATTATSSTATSGRVVPNQMHALFTQASPTWGLDRSDQRSLPLNGQYAYDVRGEDVDVFIVDTGIHVGHQQFEGRATFYYNAVDDLDYDCLGHGTHVAGIVGSALYGVAKRANLIAVKVLDCSGVGSTFTILDGLRAVLERVAQSGRRSVINLSLGGDRSNLLDNALLAIAQYNNTAVVVAAGNDGSDACNYSPSNLGSAGTVLSVGASDMTDARPFWSNTGACVDLSAPGLGIQSTWIGASNTSVAVLSGTSMAAPFVAGVCALVLCQSPSITITQVNALITNAAWPNTVRLATQSGGGRKLLYARINPNAPTPAPPTRVPTRAPVSQQPSHHIPHQASSAVRLTSLLGGATPLLMLVIYTLFAC